ncbi:hypothetical protein AVEN_260449-1 [Araneus ventricosus]|uniref:Uncharacterized protein n=1 Tax=Araneus ventricosus TaxID=182803 RepID=A0A4Y2IN46_ARAVE|nr:hypothetical protein AVEN_260449-1 [Araneus ventricosus]
MTPYRAWSYRERNKILNGGGIIRHALKNDVKNNSPALTVTVTVKTFRNFPMATPPFSHGNVMLTVKNLKWSWNGIYRAKNGSVRQRREEKRK